MHLSLSLVAALCATLSSANDVHGTDAPANVAPEKDADPLCLTAGPTGPCKARPVIEVLGDNPVR